MSTVPKSRVLVHVCISGFTQNAKRPHGVFKLAERLCELGFNNHVSRVELHPWNANWNEIAEKLWLIGEHHKSEVAVNIYAYSWGMGWGAVRLCESLKARGIDVSAIVSCDGVYRHPLFCLRWLSLLRRKFSPAIRIPSNVHRVLPIFQRQNRPQGSEIRGGKDFTGVICQPVEVRAEHQYMDDSAVFQVLSVDFAQALQDTIQ